MAGPIWASVTTTAAALGCSRMTVYRAIRDRKVRYRVKTGVTREVFEVDLAHAQQVLAPKWKVVEPK